MEQLHGCTHQVVADRIETGTFLCAVAATGGDVVAQHGRADHLEAVIEKLRDAGVTVTEVADGIRVQSGRCQAAQGAELPHHRIPGFPDRHAGPVHGAQLHWRRARRKVTETIFENRFMHVNELVRLGANIQIDGKVAVIEGVRALSGATVMATDLRASASLVIAGLVAEGETVVDRIYHLDRGYDQMEAKLRGLGADIERVKS